MEPMPDPPRPLRKDAERNRQRILAAADELFAERGLDVTLDDIAARAGLGVGTVYRRYANKDELIDEHFEQRVAEFERFAQDALADEDAGRGLKVYLERCLERQLESRGLTEILNSDRGRERLNLARDRIAPLNVAIVAHAKEQGGVRADFAPTDLAFIQLALAGIMDATRSSKPNLYRRYLAMFLDGIAAERRETSALPVRALTSDETHEIMKRTGKSPRRVR
jgi:AcrR family transcriptional regulator